VAKPKVFIAAPSTICTPLEFYPFPDEFQSMQAETGPNYDTFDVFLTAPSGKCEGNAPFTAKTAVHSD